MTCLLSYLSLQCLAVCSSTAQDNIGYIQTVLSSLYRELFECIQCYLGQSTSKQEGRHAIPYSLVRHITLFQSTMFTLILFAWRVLEQGMKTMKTKIVSGL